MRGSFVGQVATLKFATSDNSKEQTSTIRNSQQPTFAPPFSQGGDVKVEFKEDGQITLFDRLDANTQTPAYVITIRSSAFVNGQLSQVQAHPFSRGLGLSGDTITISIGSWRVSGNGITLTAVYKLTPPPCFAGERCCSGANSFLGGSSTCR